MLINRYGGGTGVCSESRTKNINTLNGQNLPLETNINLNNNIEMQSLFVLRCIQNINTVCVGKM